MIVARESCPFVSKSEVRKPRGQQSRPGRLFACGGDGWFSEFGFLSDFGDSDFGFPVIQKRTGGTTVPLTR